MVRKLLLLLCLLSLYQPVSAQSTAQGSIISYNEQDHAAVLDLDESDLRFNQIDTTGGLVSLTIRETTLQAYFLPATADATNLTLTLRLLGFDPARDGIELVLILARSGSILQHIDRRTNPLSLFTAQVGDRVRLAAIAPLPTPQDYQLRLAIAALAENGDLVLPLSPLQATAEGLFEGVSGTIDFLNGQTRSFLVVEQDDYLTAPYAEIFILLTDDQVLVAPSPTDRPTLNIANNFLLAPSYDLLLSYQIFDPSTYSTGYITEIQGEGQILLTDVPDTFLDDIGVKLGGYAIVTINGQLRGALVLDESMFASALQVGGLSSNYILLKQTGILKLVYVLGDGRNAQAIFAATPGARVWIRPAQAVETIVREEAIVKAVAEIDPDGFLYTDISPFELSYLTVLVGEHVNVNINGISYRARVVDDELLAEYNIVPTATPPEDLILLYPFPFQDRLIITHTADDTITAEARFQASVGDAVVISPAPN